MSCLDTLPVELVLDIIHQLTSQRDINALAQTNSHLYHIINPYLYDFEIRQHGRETVFIWAAKSGQVNTAKYILTRTEDTTDVVNSTDPKFKLSALSWAAAKGHEGVVELLLSCPGINPDPRNQLNRSPLSHAAENGHVGIVKRLLETGGCEVNSKDSRKGRTPLVWAMFGPESRDAEEVERQGGCSHRKATHKDGMPWSLDRMRMLEVLPYRRAKRGGLAFEHCDCPGRIFDEVKERAAVRWVVGSVYEEIVLLLLGSGADIDLGDFRGSPVSLAAGCGATRSVEFLLDRGADVSWEEGLRAPLTRAAGNGDVAMVKLLLERQVIHRQDGLHAPLGEAARGGHLAVLEMLLPHPLGPPEMRGDGYHGPLEEAVKYGRTEAVDALLEWHQRIRPSEGLDAVNIWWAAYAGWETIFERLLDAGMRVSGDPPLGMCGIPVLSAAVMGRNMNILRLVLEQPDVDVDQEDGCGWTATSWASVIANGEALNLLVSHGALTCPKETEYGPRPPHSIFQRWGGSECDWPADTRYPLSFGEGDDPEYNIDEYADGPVLSREMEEQFEMWPYNRPGQQL